jgi:hypothetical protein
MAPSPHRAAVALAAAAVAAALALPAGAGAQTIRVGVADQSLTHFADPTFRALDFRQTRYFVHWNVMRNRDQRLRMRAWVLAARASGMRPLVHLSTTRFDGRAPRPSVSRYRSEVRRLVPYLRRLGVRDFGVWNEANHKTQPTWSSPSHAALYFREMYRAVHARCSTRSCRVVALDVLDQRGRERYVRRFYERLSPTWQRRARFVGIHNYSDVNRRSLTRTRSIIREVRRHNRAARFWFTETGGVVGFGRGFPCDPSSPASVAAAERRAQGAVTQIFRVARTYRKAGVQRIYLYNWYGNDCAPNERTVTAAAPQDRAGFDAGVVRADGTPRPSLRALVRGLQSRGFAR